MSKDDKIELLRNDGEELFAQWLEMPSTKLLISMIPKSDHPDLLITILRSSFDAGQASGVISILKDFARHYTKRKETGG